MNALFIVACIVLFVVPVWLVINPEYEDGLIGRIGLLGMSFASATFLMEFAFGDTAYEILPQTVLMASCFVIFLCRHLYRFHRRVLRQREHETQG